MSLTWRCWGMETQGWSSCRACARLLAVFWRLADSLGSRQEVRLVRLTCRICREHAPKLTF